MPPKAKAKDAVISKYKIDCNSSWDLLVASQVGLPNVGKSTLSNTLKKLSVPAENSPFCIIEPNEGRVTIPDERFDWICQLYKPKSEVRNCNDYMKCLCGINRSSPVVLNYTGESCSEYKSSLAASDLNLPLVIYSQ